MKKFNVTVQADIEISFDEESEEFKTLFEHYLEYFTNDTSYESFCENIASLVARYGVDEFIEGVGYLKLNGENQNVFVNSKYSEQPSIINIETYTDLNLKIDFDTQVEEIEYNL